VTQGSISVTKAQADRMAGYESGCNSCTRTAFWYCINSVTARAHRTPHAKEQLLEAADELRAELFRRYPDERK
jgi:hypothetical protein